MNKIELAIKIIVNFIEYQIILLFYNNSTLYLFFNIFVSRNYFMVRGEHSAYSVSPDSAQLFTLLRSSIYPILAYISRFAPFSNEYTCR